MRGLVFFALFVVGLGFIVKSPFNGVLVWYIFSLGNPHRLAYGLFGTLPYAYVISITTILMWLTRREDKVRLPMTPLVVITLAFSAWTTITSFAAVAPPDAVWSQWVEVQKMLLMTLIGYALTTSRERLIKLIWVVVLSIGFWGAKGGVFAVLHGGSYRVYGPPATQIGDNNDLGLALVMILPLLFYLWRMATSRYVWWGLLIMGGSIIIAIFFTYSRGAFLATGAMSVIFWLRSRKKLSSALVIICAGVFIYNFAPAQWFMRMNSIETYQSDGSAMGRIYFWKIAWHIAEARPFLGGGFQVTFFPNATNPFIAGTDLPALTRARAVHSIYMETLAEQGFVGLALFILAGLVSWTNLSWMIRHSAGRKELVWANLLGRMGQASLVGFWVGGTFLSLEYYDGYWCLLFIIGMGRRLLAQEIEVSPRRNTPSVASATFGSLRGAGASLPPVTGQPVPPRADGAVSRRS